MILTKPLRKHQRLFYFQIPNINELLVYLISESKTKSSMKIKNIIILFFVLLFAFNTKAQYGNFRKYQVAQTGCYCYMPADPGNFEEQKSEDGQLMYLAEVEVNDNLFGIIMVVLNKEFSTYSANDLKDLLVSYMDFLKESFEVTGSAGYGYGHTLSSNLKAQGIIDYWQCKEGKEIAVKGWIDNNTLAFLYVKGKELPNPNVQSMFLNGFIFKK
jgi:hypothetical protein